MIKDREYHLLAANTYNIEKGGEKTVELYSEIENKYKILALEDNQNNGMQAMAVAPVNDRGEVDTSKIVIV
ncbi:hypothetical protein [Gemella morbillorum]|uniref:hypothetical protein n=1 Tax=Gemella morbillorum TaxID=29391 RepID=UPI001CB215CC|nr:hypothetical protein [Gemella morbillorum]MBF1212474.1 hypothetical protein [Gemella morbillorum]